MVRAYAKVGKGSIPTKWSTGKKIIKRAEFKERKGRYSKAGASVRSTLGCVTCVVEMYAHASTGTSNCVTRCVNAFLRRRPRNTASSVQHSRSPGLIPKNPNR